MATVKEKKTLKDSGFSLERKKPLSGKELRMQVDERAFRESGLRPYWALDRPGRIKELIDSGYRFVSQDDFMNGEISGLTERDGAVVIDAAARDRHTGEPLKQYLMAIPLELWKQDQAAKRERRDERMSQIKSGIRQNIDEQVDTSDRISIKRTEGKFT